MTLDIQVIAALIGILGLFIVALLSSAGYFYRGRLEEKKSARKVLYLLLEIRYAINVSIFDPSHATTKYINHYVKRLNQKGIEAKIDDIEESLSGLVQSHFTNIAVAAKTDIEDRLLHPFEESLSDLAEISPVLAYRLRGKEKIETLASLTSTYMESLHSTFFVEIEEEWLRNVMLQASNEAKSEAVENLSKHLDEEILLLSKYCGWLDYRRSKSVVSTRFGDLTVQDYSELDKFIDNVSSKIMKAASKTLQPTDC